MAQGEKQVCLRLQTPLFHMMHYTDDCLCLMTDEIFRFFVFYKGKLEYKNHEC